MSSVRIVCRPLMRWPGQLRRPEQRDPGRRFRVSWQATTDLLEREAAMIGTRELVIQLAVEEAELRRDGWPRAHTQPRHPGAMSCPTATTAACRGALTAIRHGATTSAPSRCPCKRCGPPTGTG